MAGPRELRKAAEATQRGDPGRLWLVSSSLLLEPRGSDLARLTLRFDKLTALPALRALSVVEGFPAVPAVPAVPVTYHLPFLSLPLSLSLSSTRLEHSVPREEHVR